MEIIMPCSRLDGHETIATDDFEILAFNAFGEAIMAQEGNTDDPD